MIRSLIAPFILAFIFIATNASALTCITSNCHDSMSKANYRQFHVHGPLKAQNCKVCHLATTEKTASNHIIFKKQSPLEINKTCFVCHDEVQASLRHTKNVHQVIDQKSCTSCHDPHKSKNLHLLKLPEKTELCLKCHETKVQGNHAYHNLAKMPDGCLSCHQPHASNNKKLLKDEVASLCLKCHSKEITKDSSSIPSVLSWSNLPKDKLHPPVAKGKCQACHNPHGTESRYLLEGEYSIEAFGGKSTVENPGSISMCIDCHEVPKFNTPNTLEDTNFRNGNLNLHFLHLRGAKRSKSCMACHDPHGSIQGHTIRSYFSYANQLIPLKYKQLENGGSCATMCHTHKEYNRIKAVENGTEH
jgi:predicted CXXCH cytochrome family protein